MYSPDTYSDQDIYLSESEEGTTCTNKGMVVQLISDTNVTSNSDFELSNIHKDIFESFYNGDNSMVTSNNDTILSSRSYTVIMNRVTFTVTLMNVFMMVIIL